MKDKEWLQGKLLELYYTRLEDLEVPEGLCKDDQFGKGFRIALKKAQNLKDQLDEPEVLSQELPVIPKYVADWIEDLKSKKINLLESIYDFTHGEDINNYMREQGNVLMRAWLDGYEVEKKPLYYVPLGVVRSDGNEFYLAKTSLGIITIDPSSERYVKDKRNAHYYRFTEREIKDYNEYYWPFTVPVEDEDFDY